MDEHQTIGDASVALVHDWIPQIGGAERVLGAFADRFPQSEIFTLFNFLSPDERREVFGEMKVHASHLNDLPFAHRLHRYLSPFCMHAIERFDVSHFDIVLSSTVNFAKGVLTNPDQLHACYMHSPPRYAWDMTFEYLEDSGNQNGLRGILARRFLHDFRLWDLRTIPSIDTIMCNSYFVRRRIRKYYQRDATVIYPPVDVDYFEFQQAKDDYYVTAGRFVSYKKIDLIVDAFAQMPNKRLIVIGNGPDEARLRRKATPNIEFTGWLPRDELKHHFEHAKAFVFAALEDFGITPLEAQACGTPVIALGYGGTTETIIDRPESNSNTGIHYSSQTSSAIVDAVLRFESEQGRISQTACRENAMHFAPERFASKIENHLTRSLEDIRGDTFPRVRESEWVNSIARHSTPAFLQR